MGGGAPDPPNPYTTANAQFQQNMGTAAVSSIMNNPNVYGPSGSTQYSLAGYETATGPNGEQIKVPRYNQTTTLSKDGQSQMDSRNNLINQLFGQVKGTPQINTKGLPGYQTSYQVGNLKDNFKGPAPTLGFMNLGVDGGDMTRSTGTRGYKTPSGFGAGNLARSTGTSAYNNDMNLDMFGQQLNLKGYDPSYTGEDLKTSYAPKDGFSADRRRVENAMMSRADALTKETRDSEVARLAAMGLAPGGAKYGRVADQFEKAQNDRAMAAILAGGEEQSRMLGEARSAAGFTNDAMKSAYGMDMGLTEAENARRAEQMGFNRDTLSQNNAARQAMSMFGFNVDQAENARRGQEAGFRNEAIGQGYDMVMGQQQRENDRRVQQATFRNTTVQSQMQMATAQREMENARRTGDREAYNRALESFNNAQIAETQMRAGEAGFTNQTRNQMFDERVTMRNNIINQLMGVMGGAQVNSPNAPGYTGSGIAAPDLTGLISNNYNQQVGAYNNKMAGIASIFSAFLK